ncbi:MAG: restriction endonuclease subunit S [Eubacteriales bacterium]|nr:restriction endonuclease subunit S [Eubacteriales bacterium]
MIDTAALREKVLDLAIRGKLVPQDPNDEPASVLLERIHEQKLQMVREGKLKAKDVKDDTIIFKGDDNCYYEKYSDGSVKNIQDEIPFDLPNGWSWSRISSIGTTNIGLTYKPTEIADEGTIVLRSSNIKNGKIDLTDLVRVKTIIRENQFVEQNDIVICARNGSKALVGKCAIFNLAMSESVSFGAFMAILRTAFYDYVYYFLNTQLFRNILNSDDSKQINQLTQDMLKNTLIPFPPQNEQRKIVTALNEIMHQISSIDNNANAVEHTKEVLKSRIIELAIQGKLVPQDEKDEPANVLLERIRAERKAKLGKKYVESYIYKGDDNCYYENNVNNPVEIPFVLPKNWAFSRLADIAWLEDGVKIDGEQLPYLDAKAIRGKQTASMLSCGKVIEKGMQVILVDGENSGEVFEVPCRGYIGSTFKVLQVSYGIEKSYVKLILDFYKNLFKDNKTGSAIPHLNKKIFKSLIVAIPPVGEQKLIIEKVNLVTEILKDGV